MGRRKRSEKLREIKELPLPTEVKVMPAAAEVMAAICPICGRSVPENRALKVGTVTVGKVGYFDSIDWEPDKPFGVAYQASGRGSFNNWRHIDPSQAPELFEALKGRFIDSIREWLAKGWIKRGEIEQGE